MADSFAAKAMRGPMIQASLGATSADNLSMSSTLLVGPVRANSKFHHRQAQPHVSVIGKTAKVVSSFFRTFGFGLSGGRTGLNW
jgi:hypothetical protein